MATGAGNLVTIGRLRALMETIKGWLGFENRAGAAAISQAFIRLLGKGKAQGVFNAEQLALVETAVKKMGLFANFKRRQKSRSMGELNALIKTTAMQILQKRDALIQSAPISPSTPAKQSEVSVVPLAVVPQQAEVLVEVQVEAPALKPELATQALSQGNAADDCGQEDSATLAREIPLVIATAVELSTPVPVAKTTAVATPVLQNKHVKPPASAPFATTSKTLLGVAIGALLASAGAFTAYRNLITVERADVLDPVVPMANNGTGFSVSPGYDTHTILAANQTELPNVLDLTQLANRTQQVVANSTEEANQEPAVWSNLTFADSSVLKAEPTTQNEPSDKADDSDREDNADSLPNQKLALGAAVLASLGIIGSLLPKGRKSKAGQGDRPAPWLSLLPSFGHTQWDTAVDAIPKVNSQASTIVDNQSKTRDEDEDGDKGTPAAEGSQYGLSGQNGQQDDGLDRQPPAATQGQKARESANANTKADESKLAVSDVGFLPSFDPMQWDAAVENSARTATPPPVTTETVTASPILATSSILAATPAQIGSPSSTRATNLDKLYWRRFIIALVIKQRLKNRMAAQCQNVQREENAGVLVPTSSSLVAPPPRPSTMAILCHPQSPFENSGEFQHFLTQ